MAKSPWPTFEEWSSCGIKLGYEKRNPRSLEISKNKQEKSWYRRGGTMRWLTQFNFRKILEWLTFEEWKRFGIERGYNHRNYNSFRKSKNPKERKWINRGGTMRSECWNARFPFKRRREDSPWPTFEEWSSCGIKLGYEKRNPRSLEISKNKQENRWYQRGETMGCLTQFNFRYQRGTWKNFDEWAKEGKKCRYHERHVSSLYTSENPEERKWVSKGYRMRKEEWIKKFPFKSEKNSYKITQEQYQEQMHQDPKLACLTVAAGMLNGNGADIERIILDVYDGKFKSAEELHRLVQDSYEEARKIISEGRTNLGHFVGDFTVSESPAIPVFIEEAVELIPKDKISGPVEDRFVRVLRHVYGPRFNDSPQETLDELAEKSAPENSRKSRGLYERLYGHYSKVMEAMR